MNKTTKFNIIYTLLALLTFGVFYSVPASAQSIGDFSLFEFATIQDLLDGVRKFLVALAIPIAGLVIIWGGYQYFLGGFDQKADGKKAITSAVIGLAIVLSYSIITALVTGSIDGGKINTAPIIALITNFTEGLIGISSFIAVGVIIYGGYKYMFSSLPGAKGDGKEAIQNGVLGLVAIAIATPLIAVVQATIRTTSGTSPLNTTAVQNFILSFINGFLIPLSSVVTVLFFIIGGYYILTSNGDSGQYKKGLDILKNAAIGLVVVLVSFTIAQITIYAVRGFSL